MPVEIGGDILFPGGGTYTKLCWFPLSEALGPSPTPVEPQVNLWIQAGENFSVGFPTLENVYEHQLLPIVMERDVVEQSGLGAASEQTFGEIVDDLTLLTRRATRYCKWAPVGDHYTIPVQPRVRSNGAPLGHQGEQRWSFGTYLSTAFYGESGSYVWKLSIPERSEPFVVGFSDQMGVTTPDAVNEPRAGEPVDFVDMDAEKVLEVRIPDFHTRQFKTTAIVLQADTTAMFVVGLADSPSASVLTPATLYVAHGDDWRCGGFLYAPPYYNA